MSVRALTILPSSSFAVTKSVTFVAASSQSISMGNVLNQSGSGTFSLAIWAKMVSLPASGYKTFIGKAVASPYQGFEIQVTSSGKLSGSIGSDDSHYMEKDSTTNVISTGTWYFLVWSSAGGTAGNNNFYLNGSAVTMSTISNTFSTTASNTANFQIGTRGVNYVDALLDQASIWSVALSSGEVSALYNSGTPTNLLTSTQAANLTGWWQLGEGTDTLLSGSGINDSSTGGHAGTGVNFSTNASITTDVP